MNQRKHDTGLFWRLVLLTMLIPLAYLALFVGMPAGTQAQAYASAALREGVKEASNRLLTTGPMVLMGHAPKQSAPSASPLPQATPTPEYFDPGSLFAPKTHPLYTVYYYVEAQGIPQSTCDNRRIETGTFHMRFGDWPFYSHYVTTLTTNNCGNVSDTWTQSTGTPFTYQWKGRKWITTNIDDDVEPGMVVMFVLNRAADGTNDNVIDIEDFNLLKSGYGICSPAIGYIETADYEKDWCLDILDFHWLHKNYGEAGEPLGPEV